MNRKVKMKHIAAMAGVSVMTVSRVVNGKPGVSQETRQRILKLIREFNYISDPIATSLQKQETSTFGIIMPLSHQNDSYWELSLAGMEAAVREVSHFNINLRYYQYDRYLEDSYVKSYTRAIYDNNDGLLIAPVLSRLAEDHFKAEPPQVPYVLFDADIPDCEKLSFIGQDSYAGGMTAGKLMSILVQSSGELAVIKIAPADYHINVRAAGFQSYFDDHPLIDIQTYNLPNLEVVDVFDKLVIRMIDENRDLKGIFVPNASTYHFAHALSSLNLPERIFLIGYDLIRENISCLQQGSIDFIINQQPIRQGYEGIMALYNQIILKKTIQREKLLPVEIVTRENLHTFSDHHDQYHSNLPDPLVATAG